MPELVKQLETSISLLILAPIVRKQTATGVIDGNISIASVREIGLLEVSVVMTREEMDETLINLMYSSDEMRDNDKAAILTVYYKVKVSGEQVLAEIMVRQGNNFFPYSQMLARYLMSHERSVNKVYKACLRFREIMLKYLGKDILWEKFRETMAYEYAVLVDKL